MQLLAAIDALVLPLRAVGSWVRAFGELVWPLPVGEPVGRYVLVPVSPYAGDFRRPPCFARSRC